MTERESPSINQLSTELQRQLNFEMDSSGEWLINDEFTNVGGLEFGEDLPSRARVSKDGTRYEIGARRQDVEGLLELNRLVSPSVQSVDNVLNFWQDHPKISTRVEDEWVYVGTNIEPTTEGLERDVSSVHFAYDVALESAISGRSYEELAQDERWYGNLIKQIEETNRSGKTILFGRSTGLREDSEEGATCEIRAPITAENMREYPLDTHRTSLIGIPGKMKTWEGEERSIKGAWIIAHNGREDVDIIDTDSDYDWEKREWHHERTQISFPIPEGVEINKVDDLSNLHKAVVSLTTEDEGHEENKEMVLDVNVEVEDNSFRISSLYPENPFSVEMEVSACTCCETPYWKFRWPNEEEMKEENNLYKEFGMHGIDIGGARGNYECTVDTEEGRKLYCFDCVKKLEADYLEEHPTAKRSAAIEIAREKLSEAGYPDVEIWDTQVWRMRPGEWDLYTYIEYERDGKTIRRHTGIPTLTDDGEFEPNLATREYIDFRYKAE